MRAAKHAPRDPFRLLERRHGLADIIDRGVGIRVERLRVIPVKDAAGKPVALQFMGRAGPVGASDLAYAFDDELLRGLDVPFLRDVDVLVEAMVAEDPSLARVAPEIVTRDLSEE